MKKKFHFTRKWSRIALISAFLLAIILRCVYFQEAKAIPFFRAPVVDSAVYHEWALDIMQGKGMERGTFRGVFFMSPGYPLFLAAIYLAGGDYQLHTVIIQSLIGLLNIFLIYKIAERVFNKTVAFIALFLSVFYGLFLFYEFLLLLATLYIFFNLLLFYLLLRWREEPSRLRLLASAGLTLGVATVLRPSSMLLLPFLLVWIWMILKQSGLLLRSTLLKKFLAASILLIIFFSLPVAPITVYNWSHGNDFNLITFAGGPSFLLGNSSWSNGTLNVQALRNLGVDSADPREMFQVVASIVDRSLGEQARPSRISSYCYRNAWAFITSSPGKYLGLIFKKLRLLTNPLEIGSNYDFYSMRRHSMVLRICFINFGLLFPFALLGIVLSGIHWRKYLLLYFFVVQFVVFSLLFYVLSRYRLPAVPFLIIFAGYGIWRMARYLKDGHPARFGIGLVILIAGFSLSHLDPGTEKLSSPNYNLGVAYTRRSEYKKAIQAYRECLKENPEHYRAHYNLGNIFYERGEWEESIKEYKQALVIKIDFEEARHNLANAYAKKRSFPQAIAQYQKLLESNPNDHEIYYNLSLVYRQMGKEENAEKAYRKFWELEFKEK